MILKILNCNKINFLKNLEIFLNNRKLFQQNKSTSVKKIIKNVIKNGDKAVLKYEKKFNKNKIIIPSKRQISKSISSLDNKVKKLSITALS